MAKSKNSFPLLLKIPLITLALATGGVVIYTVIVFISVAWMCRMGCDF